MDPSNEHVTKKRTTELLLEMMEDFHLEDLANRTGNKQHTWYRRNDNQILSRLAMILTNLPIRNPKYQTKTTIFDHAWTQASFGQKREQTNPTMKDYILGSEEFQLQYYDLLENELASCLPIPPPTDVIHASHPVNLDFLPQSPNNLPSSASNTTFVDSHSLNPDPYTDEIKDTDLSRQPMDNRLTAHNLETGCTDLHILNDVIKNITQLHN
jgi:hypothetical protein